MSSNAVRTLVLVDGVRRPLLGIVRSPLHAVATTIPVLFAYDACGWTDRYHGGGAAGSRTRTGRGRWTTLHWDTATVRSL
jgi:hypothetical protein